MSQQFSCLRLPQVPTKTVYNRGRSRESRDETYTGCPAIPSHCILTTEFLCVLMAVETRGKKRLGSPKPPPPGTVKPFLIWICALGTRTCRPHVQARHRAPGQLESHCVEEREESLRENSNCPPPTPWCLGDETKQMGLGTRLPTEGPTKCQ